MHMAALKPLPGPSLLAAVLGLRRHGFLTYIDQLWQACGDTFQLRLGCGWRIYAARIAPRCQS